jgi:glyoxylase-like metal-dependent hydrolase (beta-lactamase superfamily II)
VNPIRGKLLKPSLIVPRTAAILAATLLGTAILAVGTYAQQTQNFENVEIHILPVQGNVYMMVGAGGNITLQVGQQGVLLVDTEYAQLSDKIIAAIRTISNKPIRTIINTNVDPDHVGGNENIAKAGITIIGGVISNSAFDIQPGAQILAHENLFNRMNGVTGGKANWPTAAWPTDPYSTSPKKLYSNDEGIEIIHVPAAHTDGDSIVFFRRSDVISAGDIFVTTSYPVINLERGGSIQGIIDGLNLILDLTIAKQESEGGTYVIPGHGRVSDQFDVLEYRDMVTIIRDRIQAMIKKGMTLDKIKASHPTEDYDARYGVSTGSWTTDMFIETVYKSLSAKK